VIWQYRQVAQQPSEVPRPRYPQTTFLSPGVLPWPPPTGLGMPSWRTRSGPRQVGPWCVVINPTYGGHHDKRRRSDARADV